MSGSVYRRPTQPIVSKSEYDLHSDCWKTQILKVEEIQKDLSNGEGAILGFLDDGIGENIELINNYIERWTYFKDKKTSKAGEHSTHGASLIGGATIGIFPKMGFISKQVLSPDTGVGGSSEIVSAIYECKRRDIRTINLSLGCNTPDPHIERALKDYCSNGKNIATIAAGNDGKMTDYPAKYAKSIKGVISVAATELKKDGSIVVTGFSSRGVVTISAPGVNLKSMDHNDVISLVSGTSFSAPIVGCTISVARTIRPEITQDEILYLLSRTSQKLHEGFEVAGHGQIDIYNFLKAVKHLDRINVPKTKSIKKSIVDQIKEWVTQ